MQDNKQVVQEFVKALGKGDVARLEALMAPNIEAICTGTCMLSGSRNYANICDAARMLSSVIPAGIDFRMLQLTAEADRVAGEFEGSATLVNGTPYNNQYHFLFFLRDGKIYKIKEYMDTKLVESVLAPLAAAAGR